MLFRSCERILVLSFGQKIAEDSPQVVSQNPEVISAYLGTDIDTGKLA